MKRELLSTERWSHRDWVAKRTAAPTPGAPLPDGPELLELCRRYTGITGDPVSQDPQRPNKRTLIANCAALHGPEEFLALVGRIYAQSRTATNLLGIVRSIPRGETVSPPAPVLHVVPSEPEPAPPKRRAQVSDWDLDDLPLGIVDPADPTHSSVTVPCDDYRGHYASHRYQGNGVWTCERCPHRAEVAS